MIDWLAANGVPFEASAVPLQDVVPHGQVLPLLLGQ